MIACALCGLLVAVVVLHTRGAFGDAAEHAPPLHEVYTGRTEEGGRIRLERWDDAYEWRVDSRRTSMCAPGRISLEGSTTQNNQHLLATDGSFADNGGWVADYDIAGRAPKRGRVRFSLLGRLADGRLTGRFERHDRLYRGDVMWTDCVSRTSFDVPKR